MAFSHLLYFIFNSYINYLMCHFNGYWMSTHRGVFRNFERSIICNFAIIRKKIELKSSWFYRGSHLNWMIVLIAVLKWQNILFKKLISEVDDLGGPSLLVSVILCVRDRLHVLLCACVFIHVALWKKTNISVKVFSIVV